MHDNFKNIIYLTGKFGIIIREHAEQLVYTGSYGRISANTTFAKLEREYGILKRIDRGKRKSDGYCLTRFGIKEFRRLYGIEPKVYNSLDKLSHSIKIFNFYNYIYKDAISRGLINNYNIIEEKKIINFFIHREYDFIINGKNKSMISDAFCVYKYANNKGIVFNLEIENSDRTSSYIATKKIENYENYFHSSKWRYEKWQPEKIKIFPTILIVTYSEFKCLELIRNFKKKINIKFNYLFTTYDKLESEGISGTIWFDIDKNIKKLIN